MIRINAWLAVLLPLASVLQAQEPIFVSAELDRYVRFLELDGDVRGTPLVFRTPAWTGSRLTADTTHPWNRRHSLLSTPATFRDPTFAPLGWEAALVYNSTLPRTGNDGALWAGRGVSLSLAAGGEARWGPVTGRLFPTFVYSQNQAFDLAPVSDTTRSLYAYPWHRGIDVPQRFGNRAIKRVDPGESAVRVDLGAFTAGISNESLWWGPGLRNALIMSNTAPGFPHFDIGLGHPVRTKIGTIELRALWGILKNSPYSDDTVATDRRLLGGITIGYQPGFLPGLTLGFTRVLYQNWPARGLRIGTFTNILGGFFNAGDHVLPGGVISNDLADQLASITARWVIPEGGFEAYLEWGRTDFAGNLRDLLIQPDHSRAYTLGFQKAIRSAEARWRLALEVTTLGSAPGSLVRVPTSPTWYAHNYVLSGYTNRGQLIGAAIGPGSGSQYLGVDRYTASGRWGVFLERIRYDDDYFLYSDSGQSPFRNAHFGYLAEQVDLTLGFSAFRFMGGLDVGGSLELTRELNRYFRVGDDASNIKATFSVGWRAVRKPAGIGR